MKSMTLISLAVLGSFAFYGNAHAYSGSYCDNYLDSQAGDFNRQFNGIRDNANSTRLVSCPIIADEVSITAGTTQVRVHYSGTGQPAVLFVA